MQSEARRARYAALGEWATERGLAAIMTAHHADDQAETLLMRLNRGSGLAGLAGVRPVGVVPNSDVPVLRPLLQWRNAELVAIAHASGLELAADPSNDDTRFDRVAMRRHLTQAEWIDPAAFARSAAHLAEAEAYCAQQIARSYAERVTYAGTAIEYRPCDQPFADIEIVRQIIGEWGGAPSRSEVDRLVNRLGRSEAASLAGVHASAIEKADEIVWRFRPEPHRKAGEF